MLDQLANVYPNNGEYESVQKLYYTILERANESPKEGNALRECLASLGVPFISNMMDRGNDDRKFVQQLALILGHQDIEYLSLRPLKKTIEWNDPAINRITSIYDLAHYFANVAQNLLKLPQNEWEANILELDKYGIGNLPNEYPGFASASCVESVGGIRTWELVRDLVFEYYLFEPNRETN